LTIGENVKTIGDYAFFSCLNLTGDLIIPDSVTSIGNFVFTMYGSNSEEGISNIIIGKKVVSIGNSAFLLCNCTGKLKISGLVQTIGSFAFADCSSLIGVTIDHGAKLIGPGSSEDEKNLKFFQNCESLKSITLNGFTDDDD
jgi:hypothetical protein